MHPLRLMGIVITLSITLHNSLAWRNYNLILTDIKCIVNPDFVSHVSCIIDNTTSIPSIYVDGQMIKEVKVLRLDFYVDLERHKGDSISLFHGNDIDGCYVLTTNVTQPLVKMYKELTSKAGVLPKKCPVAADYHYNFTNLTLDTNYLPTFVPETDFKISINLKERKTSFWAITVLGSVVNKNQNKERRHF